MKTWDKYVKQHAKQNHIVPFNQTRFTACVVIPCYDEPSLLTTIHYLLDNNFIDGQIAIIVVINSGVNAPEKAVQQNRQTYKELVALTNSTKNSTFFLVPLLLENLPKKQTGVGYARKVGMDYAVWLFHQNKNYDGVIISLDADCKIETNFLSAILSHYKRNVNLGFTVQYFEHFFDSPETINAIIEYELYLRYFKNALHYIGYPYAIHTVGSCFSVKADTYVKHGGMNRKQGGEDFYFLYKIAPHAVYETVSETTVYPSSRLSDRVPFGTGPELSTILAKKESYLVYHPEVFYILKEFFAFIPSLYKVGFNTEMKEKVKIISPFLFAFLVEDGFEDWIIEISQNVASLDSFKKRFFSKFTVFKMVKFLNSIHQTEVKKIPVEVAAKDLLLRTQNKLDGEQKEELLALYRALDKND